MKKIFGFSLMLAILGLSLLIFLNSAAECSSKKLTIEWLSDRAVQRKFSTPRYAWLNDSSFLLLDSRMEAEDQTLEILNPQTGKRSAVFDRDKFLSSFRDLAGDEAPSNISWPNAIDPNGKALIYITDGDLYCVELSTSNISRLTKTQSVESAPDFSPDGRWVAFIRDNDIYVVEWRKGTERRLTTGASDTLLNGPFSYVYRGEIYQRTPIPYQWSPDSQAIAYLQTDESMVPISTFVNFKPQTQEVVEQRYPKAGQTNPKVRLGVVRLSSAQTTWMDCGEYEYLSRFKWLPGSQEIAIQTQDRMQREMKLMFTDTTTGTSREILIETHPAWVNLGPSSSLQFIKGGREFIWLSERDDYQHAYHYKMDGQLIRQVTKGDFMITASTLTSRSGGLAGIDEESGWLYFVSNKKALKEKHLYGVKLAGTELKRITQREGFHSVSFSPCTKYYLDTFSNASTPPSLSLHRADGTLIIEIAPPAVDYLQSFQISYPTFHTFKTDDGMELTAMMFKPPDFDPNKKYPALVNIYGGPGAQRVIDRWGRLWRSFLAQEGYIVFVFDVRAGVGKSHSTETSVYKRAYGMQNVKDILAGVRWISQMPYVDTERLGIYGGSGGGCTTVYTMTHSDVFKAGIARVPVTDWYFYDTFYTERYMSTPQDNPDGYKETSSVLAASDLKGRLLIIDGTYDDNVHIQNTWAFIDALMEHNNQFDLMVYPWRKHGIRDVPGQIHCNTMMLNFWNRHLK
jgi:dipeptidyl-peptidase-4